MSAGSWPSVTSTATVTSAQSGPRTGLTPLGQGAPVPSPAQHTNPVPLQTIGSTQNAQTYTPASTYTPPTQDDINKRPWQYKGYPAYTEWMASSPDFFLLRRFNRLNAWVQLDWQDEIVRLETELEQINEECRRNTGNKARCSSVRPRRDPMSRRREILQELRGLLKEYNEYILSYSQLRERSTAEKFQVENVKAWFWNHPKAIDEEEKEFIKKESDVIPLIEKKKSFLRIAIEKLGPHRLSSFFPARHRKGRVKSEWTKYSSNKKMEVTMTVIIVTIGLGALLGPMWWLNSVTNNNKRLGIITGFIVFFACILASATVQRPFEVLAGTAAYAAVLIVFLQQSSSGGTSSNNS